MFYAHKDQYAKVADTKTILYAKCINSMCVQNLHIYKYIYSYQKIYTPDSDKYLVHFHKVNGCINALIIHKNPSLRSLIVHRSIFISFVMTDYTYNIGQHHCT